MQVSQQDDFISHAIIGNQESVSMGVSDDAALMHILSSTLYTFPKLAVAREIICNAWDAHIAAGKQDTPIQVIVSETAMSVRDFGFGIAHQNIGPIYGVYGNSTKRDDTTVTGGFGLGSKAPFAYTDNFEVLSHHLGQKTVYRVSKSSMEKGGKPSINKIVSMPTDETGIEVSFNLKMGTNDSVEFAKLVREVIQLGEINAVVNGVQVELELPMSASPTGFLISTFRATHNSLINIRYGNVVYPIPEHSSYGDDWKLIYRVMDNLWSNTNVIFMADPDSISIAPSREAIILTDGTIETIKTLLTKFTKQMDQRDIGTVVKSLSLESVNKQVKEATTERLKKMVTNNEVFDVKDKFQLVSSKRIFVTPRKARMCKMLEDRAQVSSYTQMKKQLKELLVRKEADPKVLKDLIKLYSVNLRHYDLSKAADVLLSRHILYPLRAAQAKYPSLEKCKSVVYQNQNRYMGSMQKSIKENFRESTRMSTLLSKKALIARNAKDAEMYLDQSTRNTNTTIYVLLVGAAKASDQRALDAIDMLSSIGYEVDMHLPAKEVKEKAPVDPNAPPKPPVKRRDKKSYMTLNQSYNYERHFLASFARKNYKDQDLIKDPIAWVILRTKGINSRSIGHLSQDQSVQLMNMYGDKIAIVNSTEAAALTKQGVPDVGTFLQKHLDEKLSKEVGFKRYLAFAHHSYGNSRKIDMTMHSMAFHEEFMKSQGLRFGIDKDTAALISLIRSDYHGFEEYPLCSAMAGKVKRHPMYEKVMTQMENCIFLDCINLERVSNRLDLYGPEHKKTQGIYKVLELIMNEGSTNND